MPNICRPNLDVAEDDQRPPVTNTCTRQSVMCAGSPVPDAENQACRVSRASLLPLSGPTEHPTLIRGAAYCGQQCASPSEACLPLNLSVLSPGDTPSRAGHFAVPSAPGAHAGSWRAWRHR